MIEGEIKVGDVFDWQPYGTEGWPRAYARVRVTRITYPDPDAHGGVDLLDSTADLCADDDQSEARVYSLDVTDSHRHRRQVREECWNELPHFRDMCSRLPGESS